MKVMECFECGSGVVVTGQDVERCGICGVRFMIHSGVISAYSYRDFGGWMDFPCWGCMRIINDIGVVL